MPHSLCLGDSLCREALSLGMLGLLILVLFGGALFLMSWLILRRQRRLLALWDKRAAPEPVMPEKADSHRLVRHAA